MSPERSAPADPESPEGGGSDVELDSRMRIIQELRAWFELLLNWAPPQVMAAVCIAAASVLVALVPRWWLLVVGSAAVAVILLALAWRRPAASIDPTGVPDLGRPVGRHREVELILARLRPPGSHVSVVGRRGVGTSICATHAVKRWYDDEPVAHPELVYLSVRSDRGALTDWQVLVALARQIGVARRSVRSNRFPERTAAAIRGALSRDEKLLVLDNVDNRSLVELLRPHIADRHRLLTAGTAGAGQSTVEVGRLPDDAAVELLTAGGPVSGPGDIVRELAFRCGYAPAVIQAAARLVTDNRYTAASLLAQLRDLAEAPPHVSSALRLQANHNLQPLARADSTYAGMDRRSQRLFRRLAVAPTVRGADAEPSLHPLSREAISAATSLNSTAVASMLGRLASAQVLAQPVGDRHSIRPELVTLARIHLLRDETFWSGAQSQARLMKHLARQAGKHADERSADNQSWFRANHELLRAAVVTATFQLDGVVHPLPRRVRRWWFGLAVQLCVWYAAEEMAAEWRATCQAVGRTPRRRPQLLPPASIESAWSHNEQAMIEWRYGPKLPDGSESDGPESDGPESDGRESDGRYDRIGAVAAELAAATSDLPWWRAVGKAQILTNEGVLALDAGDPERAVDTLMLAQPMRARRDAIGRALTHLALGAALYQGARRHVDPAVRDLQLADARSRLVAAADGFGQAGELRGEAAALTNLVLVMGAMGDLGHAGAHYDRARECYDRLRHTTGRDDLGGRAALELNYGAINLDRLAARLPGMGSGAGQEEAVELRHLFERNVERRSATPTSGLARALLYLGDAEQLCGRPERAADRWTSARDTAEAVSDVECVRAAAGRLG